jgi:asparagine synthase (glutamine-hydrolysing)
LPKSRHSKVGNTFRRLQKFAEGRALSPKDRYWRWASLMNEAEAANLIKESLDVKVYQRRKENLLHAIQSENNFNQILYTDVKLVLLSDMLRKVDLMSMSHGLEVRTPFLNHQLVNFIFSLPPQFKIDQYGQKRILKDACKDLLPEEIINRPKQGFEVPLLQWFKNDLRSVIEEDLLSPGFIREQKLFNPHYVQNLREQLNSSNPVDVQAHIWALLVFNSWWKRYIA